jgi:hypothetical protein
VEERTEAPKIIVKQNATITKKSIAVKQAIDDGMTIIRALVKYGLTRKQYKQAYFISQFGNDELIKAVDKGILTLRDAYVTAKIYPDKLNDAIEAAKLKAEKKNHKPVIMKGRSNQDLVRELLGRTYADWAGFDKNVPVGKKSIPRDSKKRNEIINLCINVRKYVNHYIDKIEKEIENVARETARDSDDESFTPDMTCPNCGHHEVDDDGDCASCHEPGIVAVEGSK